MRATIDGPATDGTTESGGWDAVVQHRPRRAGRDPTIRTRPGGRRLWLTPAAAPTAHTSSGRLRLTVPRLPRQCPRPAIANTCSSTVLRTPARRGLRRPARPRQRTQSAPPACDARPQRRRPEIRSRLAPSPKMRSRLSTLPKIPAPSETSPKLRSRPRQPPRQYPAITTNYGATFPGDTAAGNQTR
jgi:hypothetical protein